MSDHNKKVEPLRFEPAASAASAAPLTAAASRAGNRNWLLAAFLSLLVLALIVFFWLPRQVDSSAIELPPAQSAARSRLPAELASPWSDAQLAKQRKDAQEVLAQLLDEQFKLEELRVKDWADEAYAAALAQAAGGDELYRQQLYLDAAAAYQLALDAMQLLSSEVATVFATQLQIGLEALNSDQAEAALTALELAVHLHPDDGQAQQALARARNLPPLLDLLRQANAARDANDLAGARQLLQLANQLDPAHSGAKVLLADIEREIARRDFNAAMSAGYQALDEQRFDDAERQFLKAQKILPTATETDGALQQARGARTVAKIEAYERSAKGAEERESWDQAVLAYREILAIDAAVAFARAGLIRSETRARLDSNLRAAIASPQRLGDEAVFGQTQALYQQALALQQRGPLLRQQLGQLDQLLQQAVIPIAVLLHSDELTQVTVLRVAQLGSFSRQQLSLKPGTYTAVGVRSGYRDVRVQFTVSHQQENPVVEVSCAERI